MKELFEKKNLPNERKVQEDDKKHGVEIMQIHNATVTAIASREDWIAQVNMLPMAPQHWHLQQATALVLDSIWLDGWLGNHLKT